MGYGSGAIAPLPSFHSPRLLVSSPVFLSLPLPSCSFHRSPPIFSINPVRRFPPLFLPQSNHKIRYSSRGNGDPNRDADSEKQTDGGDETDFSDVDQAFRGDEDADLAGTASQDPPVQESIWKKFKWFWSTKQDQSPPEKLMGFDDEVFAVQWRDILDPTPENILALLLTGLLGLAVVQIFWQLFLVAIAITVAALKYSVIAAILVALLVVLL